SDPLLTSMFRSTVSSLSTLLSDQIIRKLGKAEPRLRFAGICFYILVFPVKDRSQEHYFGKKNCA
ncbi:MAG: hypothetical protein MJ137_08265, partial [Clostridia bacterium]|nr:hypothetical protein [Clostridia bacterium]